MPKIVSVIGPTGSGKTAFAVNIASRLNGVLISIDSRQVYKGLDIISGKDLPKGSRFQSDDATEMQKVNPEFEKYSFGFYAFPNGVRIYLLDIVEPTYDFTVNDFLQISSKLIPELSKTYVPILVGGTGFYFNALLRPIDTISIPPDLALRKELEPLLLDEIQDILKKKDPGKFNVLNESEKKNKRRLIRRLEIAQYQNFQSSTSHCLNEYSQGNDKGERSDAVLDNFDILKVGLTTSRAEIKKRIDARVEKRLDQGAIAEAENLFQNYENLSVGVKDANGYKQLFEYIQGKTSLEEGIRNWRRSEYHNAKKQMTWFKKDSTIQWFNISEPGFIENATEYVVNWYNKHYEHKYSD